MFMYTFNLRLQLSSMDHFLGIDFKRLTITSKTQKQIITVDATQNYERPAAC